MDLNKPVSGREFAKLTGQSEGAVRKAVGRSSIVKGYTSDKKFIPAIASAEWGKEILTEFLGEQKKRTYNPVKKTKTKEAVRPKSIIKKQKPESTSANEIVSEIMAEKLPRIKKTDLDEEDNSEKEIDDEVSKPEAERITSIVKAKILQIALKEKQGQLVPIEKVNSVLFGYGQEIRNTMEGLPAQIIDKILACDTRHSALRILNDAVFEALNLLADIEQREL